MSSLPPPKSGLTSDQLAKLAVLLDGTAANVYDVAENAFGVRPTQDVFDELKALGFLRCPDCSYWQSKDQYLETDDADPICLDCLEPEDEDDEDDDEDLFDDDEDEEEDDDLDDDEDNPFEDDDEDD